MAEQTIEKGRIRARDVSRVFTLNVVKERSLKETILRRSLPPKRELWALRDVGLEIEPGETFGIVGQNGSGKSTLLKLIAGVFGPSNGTVEVGGRIGSLIEIGAGFHPDFTGTENVYLNAAIHGLSRSYVDEHLEEIIEFAELEDFADVAVKTYSTGMYMRLGFSVAMNVQPDILLLDEVLAVGDEAFQQKCFGKIWDYKARPRRSSAPITGGWWRAGPPSRRSAWSAGRPDRVRSTRCGRSPATSRSGTASWRASRSWSRSGCGRRPACGRRNSRSGSGTAEAGRLRLRRLPPSTFNPKSCRPYASTCTSRRSAMGAFSSTPGSSVRSKTASSRSPRAHSS